LQFFELVGWFSSHEVSDVPAQFSGVRGVDVELGVQ
jgi:hypothetical protein